MLFKFFLLLTLLFNSSACVFFKKALPSPTYSVHEGDKIKLTNFNKSSKVFIKTTANDIYNIRNRVIANIIDKLKKDNIKIVDNQEYATHVLSINIKSISIDVDYEFANSMKNLLLSNDITPSYIFDKSNSPHVNGDFMTKNFTSNNHKYGRRILPSVIWTVAGASIGFVGGWLIAGSFMPMAIGAIGAVAIGGTTYFIYNTLRYTGIIITYEVDIEEKIERKIKHSIKNLAKKSSNTTNEVYYDCYDNWITNISKNIVIAIGSRVLKNYMISNMIPFISASAVESFSSHEI